MSWSKELLTHRHFMTQTMLQQITIQDLTLVPNRWLQIQYSQPFMLEIPSSCKQHPCIHVVPKALISCKQSTPTLTKIFNRTSLGRKGPTAGHQNLSRTNSKSSRKKSHWLLRQWLLTWQLSIGRSRSFFNNGRSNLSRIRLAKKYRRNRIGCLIEHQGYHQKAIVLPNKRH